MTRPSPIPEEFRTITPHLVVRDVPRAVEFYRKGFGAEEVLRNTTQDGSIIHCELLLGDSRFFLVEENPEWGSQSPLGLGGTPVTLHLYVADVDSDFARAVNAGAEVLMPLDDQFWGDRYGIVQDPFGHRWSLASRIEDLSPAELRRRANEAFRGEE